MVGLRMLISRLARLCLWGWLLWLGVGPAQAATYTYRSDTYQWETASTAVTWDRTCTQYPGDDDKATLNFTGGFVFRFAGTNYSSVRVLANGGLQFGADTGFFRNFNNTTLPAGTATARSGCVAAATTSPVAVHGWVRKAGALPMSLLDGPTTKERHQAYYRWRDFGNVTTQTTEVLVDGKPGESSCWSI